MTIPVSAIIATRNRPEILKRTILSVLEQSAIPRELIIVDASTDQATRTVLEGILQNEFSLVYRYSDIAGAASQREQGINIATQPTVWFLDDDILLEPDCTIRLWNGFKAAPNVGAVNAMITNQRYTAPGLLTRTMYTLMHGRKLASYAGKIIGPAWNLLPEDTSTLPEYNVCEWLNTTCTMYRRDVLPEPVFPSFFSGYSLMEDVALSVTIGKTRTLLNARTARIYHDSQPGSHKSSVTALSRMELVNRYYIMKNILGRTGFHYNVKLTLLQIFALTTSLRFTEGRRGFFKAVFGKFSAILFLIKTPLN
ncbi:hypothetical protein BH09BAC3_BH09BAC3_13090 [soil metagenome]